MKKLSGLFVLAGFIITACAAQGAADPPRYKFEIGQELVYESSSDFRYEQGSFKENGAGTFWVTRHNRDGSWHLITLKKSHNVQTRQGSAQDPNDTRRFNSFDMSADGRVVGKPAKIEYESLSSPFFQLPADAAQAQAGWDASENEAVQSAYRLKTAPASAAGQWVFEATQKGIFHDIYLITSAKTIYFDGTRGLIEKVEAMDGQGFGFVGQGTGVVKLKSAEIKDQGWITQLAWEAD